MGRFSSDEYEQAMIKIEEGPLSDELIKNVFPILKEADLPFLGRHTDRELKLLSYMASQNYEYAKDVMEYASVVYSEEDILSDKENKELLNTLATATKKHPRLEVMFFRVAHNVYHKENLKIDYFNALSDVILHNKAIKSTAEYLSSIDPGSGITFILSLVADKNLDLAKEIYKETANKKSQMVEEWEDWKCERLERQMLEAISIPHTKYNGENIYDKTKLDETDRTKAFSDSRNGFAGFAFATDDLSRDELLYTAKIMIEIEHRISEKFKSRYDKDHIVKELSEEEKEQRAISYFNAHMDFSALTKGAITVANSCVLPMLINKLSEDDVGQILSDDKDIRIGYNPEHAPLELHKYLAIKYSEHLLREHKPGFGIMSMYIKNYLNKEHGFASYDAYCSAEAILNKLQTSSEILKWGNKFNSNNGLSENVLKEIPGIRLTADSPYSDLNSAVWLAANYACYREKYFPDKSVEDCLNEPWTIEWLKEEIPDDRKNILTHLALSYACRKALDTTSRNSNQNTNIISASLKQVKGKGI